MDTADNGVTNVAHEVEPLVEKFESLMRKGSKDDRKTAKKAQKKADKKSAKAGGSAKGLPPHAFKKEEILLEAQPDYNPLHYRKFIWIPNVPHALHYVSHSLCPPCASCLKRNWF